MLIKNYYKPIIAKATPAKIQWTKEMSIYMMHSYMSKKELAQYIKEYNHQEIYLIDII